MSQKFERLKTLLKELFQLDQPDLDFGLYRIMHAKSAEVTQFLDGNLLPQVKEAFALYKTADKTEIEKELAKAIEQAQGLGVDPETTQKVKDLRAKLKTDAMDVSALESEVYDHLFSGTSGSSTSCSPIASRRFATRLVENRGRPRNSTSLVENRLNREASGRSKTRCSPD